MADYTEPMPPCVFPSHCIVMVKSLLSFLLFYRWVSLSLGADECLLESHMAGACSLWEESPYSAGRFYASM